VGHRSDGRVDKNRRLLPALEPSAAAGVASNHDAHVAVERYGASAPDGKYGHEAEACEPSSSQAQLLVSVSL
jgi:hypothetical protein